MALPYTHIPTPPPFKLEEFCFVTITNANFLGLEVQKQRRKKQRFGSDPNTVLNVTMVIVVVVVLLSGGRGPT